jgi:hypothetical protein
MCFALETERPALSSGSPKAQRIKGPEDQRERGIEGKRDRGIKG